MNSIEISGAVSKMKSVIRDVNANIDDYKSHKHGGKNGVFRRDEAIAVRIKFPTKIPIIVERYHKEVDLPQLDKKKFLVPQEITFSQFLSILRQRMRVGQNKALFLLVNNRTMVSINRPVGDIYKTYKDPDGFLRLTYASQEVFG